VVDPGQAVLDAMLRANPVEDVLVTRPVGGTGCPGSGPGQAVVGRHDAVGHGFDQFTQELRSLHLACTLDEPAPGQDPPSG
jgi:hypothetical protein